MVINADFEKIYLHCKKQVTMTYSQRDRGQKQVIFGTFWRFLWHILAFLVAQSSNMGIINSIGNIFQPTKNHSNVTNIQKNLQQVKNRSQDLVGNLVIFGCSLLVVAVYQIIRIRESQTIVTCIQGDIGKSRSLLVLFEDFNGMFGDFSSHNL